MLLCNCCQSPGARRPPRRAFFPFFFAPRSLGVSVDTSSAPGPCEGVPTSAVKKPALSVQNRPHIKPPQHDKGRPSRALTDFYGHRLDLVTRDDTQEHRFRAWYRALLARAKRPTAPALAVRRKHSRRAGQSCEHVSIARTGSASSTHATGSILRRCEDLRHRT